MIDTLEYCLAIGIPVEIYRLALQYLRHSSESCRELNSTKRFSSNILSWSVRLVFVAFSDAFAFSEVELLDAREKSSLLFDSLSSDPKILPVMLSMALSIYSVLIDAPLGALVRSRMTNVYNAIFLMVLNR